MTPLKSSEKPNFGVIYSSQFRKVFFLDKDVGETY